MISRFYLEDYLSFKQIDLDFKRGLVVFTGPSGAGKSVLMSSLLALFASTETKAVMSEILIENLNISDENFSINKDDDIVIKQTTSSKTRYLLNNQTISKKNLKEFTSSFTSHLHLKDISDFNSSKLISFLDFLGTKNSIEYKNLLEDFKVQYQELKNIQIQLNKILEDESELENLIEFTKFEIDKIEKLNPKIDEYDELKTIKDNLSKKDKVQTILDEIMPFLNNTHKISSALQLLEINSEFFDDAINEVNNIFEKFNDSMNSMDDIDIENVLDRIEQLSSLNKKYGGIAEALNYKKQKQIELDGYENISFQKAILEKNIKKISQEVEQKAQKLSKYREENIKIIEEKINEYLEYLYLENLSITIIPSMLDATGVDEIKFKLNNINIDKISSGEFNRLRLALLTTRSFYEMDTSGILFLDEIDANLSGKESQSIAKVLEELSKHYQIFAISHQPQLSATAHQHFMVQKSDNISSVKLLNSEERIDEIARMISGENITNEAKQFAKKLIITD